MLRMIGDMLVTVVLTPFREPLWLLLKPFIREWPHATGK